MFYSAESALQWAGEVRTTPIYNAPSTNRMCGKPQRATQNDILIGLNAKDRHLQASNIYSMAINIKDPVLQAYLRCKYFDDYDNLSRIVSRVHVSLTDRSIDFTMLILAYLGVQINCRDITARMMRYALHCDANRVADYRNVVYGIMDKIHVQAIDQIECRMKQAGLVEDEYASGVAALSR